MNRGELHRLRTGSPAHHSRPSGPDSTSATCSPKIATVRRQVDGRHPSLSIRTCVFLLSASSPLPHRFACHPVLWRDGRAGRVACAVLAHAHGAHRWRQSQPDLESLHPRALCGAGRLAPAAGRRQLDRACAVIPPGCLAWPWFIIRCSPASGQSSRLLSPLRLRRIGSVCRFATPPTRLPRRWLSAWPSSSSAHCWPAPATARRRTVRWAVTYTNPLAARWSGAPLGVPLHPVQAYAALAFLRDCICLLLVAAASPPAGRRRRPLACWQPASPSYFTEFWRDPEGRGAMLRGRARRAADCRDRSRACRSSHAA